jgi:hypothetical protein
MPGREEKRRYSYMYNTVIAKSQQRRRKIIALLCAF